MCTRHRAQPSPDGGETLPLAPKCMSEALSRRALWECDPQAGAAWSIFQRQMTSLWKPRAVPARPLGIHVSSWALIHRAAANAH